MKIAFFSENGLIGKVPRTFENMRTEFAWMAALDAEHHPLGNTLNGAKYDIGIIIIPKKNIDKLMVQDHIGYLKLHCKKLGVMQEGPNWFWQDYPLDQQIWYYNTLAECDFILTHNYSDELYYEGLVKVMSYKMPSLMIEDSIRDIPTVERKDVMIGGNMCSWYGGFDSMVIAMEFNDFIFAPSMGRKIENEDQLDINYLPYMNWVEWIKSLNNVKYGVHLMRTHAAGTFALNCAYLGIPCIGYRGLDTQELCHKHTTVELGDLSNARQLAKRLKNDNEFYEKCSFESKENYKKYFAEKTFVEKMKKLFSAIMKESTIKDVI